MLSNKSISDWPCALAFGILAAAAGIAAGAQPLPLILLAIVMVGLHLLTERQGWLLRAGATQWARSCAVASAFSLLAISYVALTGGANSPLICALYLPILLATVCYGMRIGLLISLGMALSCGLFVVKGFRLPETLPGPDIAIALSFPLVAIFGGVLRAQLEERLSALYTEKQGLSAMLDLSQMMESAFDLDMTLNLILLNVQKHSDCQVCAVYLVGSDHSTLELRAASGPRDRVTLLPALPLDEARAGDWSVSETAHDGLKVLAFYAAERGRSASRLFEIDRTVGSFACLPLTGVEGILGMLYVGSHRPHGLTEESILRLEQVATYAGFPLQRVLLQQDFRSLAYSDPMTGLDNFRQFEETLAQELMRAERYGRQLSLVLLDIDHFKSFNDTLGHQAGDALLSQLGVVLRNSLRNVDRPARYGGEEFVIICPETGKDEARLIAERIRRNIADTAFVLLEKTGENGGEDGKHDGSTHVTVSLGCATYPGDARTSRDLVKKADTALYAAKGSGRNRVRAYEGEEVRIKAA